MQTSQSAPLKTRELLLGVFLLLLSAGASARAAEPPKPMASADFDAYVRKVEARLAGQHQSGAEFVAGPDRNAGGSAGAAARERLKRGETIVENLSADAEGSVREGLVYHWRGTAFVPGARVSDFERLMKDFNSYPQRFSPEVLEARLLSERDDKGVDRITASMRVKQKHVLTVVMDMDYDVAFARLDAEHGYSISRSTRVAEIADAGTSKEHALGDGEEHGFLWRLNTYWSYEEADGGLYMQIETVSLTRAIPAGLGWAIKPFVESVPKESMEFTLRATETGLRR